MSMQVTLERDGHDQPWGFRLQGGVDVGLPLSVLRVLVGTPSEAVLKKGDVITRIGGTGTHGLTHQQAVDLFNSAGNQLTVTLKRIGANIGGTPPALPVAATSVVATPALNRPAQSQALESPPVRALPRTTFVLKSDLPPSSLAPTVAADAPDQLSVQNQPYRTTPLVQPSAKAITELGVGSYSHLRLQEEICSGAREPQLVPVTPAQANALKANDYIMKQKTTQGLVSAASDHQRGVVKSPPPAVAPLASGPIKGPTPVKLPPAPSAPPSVAAPPQPATYNSAAGLYANQSSGFLNKKPGMINPVNKPNKNLPFFGLSKKYDPEQSATWQAIHEQENCQLITEHGPTDARSPSLQTPVTLTPNKDYNPTQSATWQLLHEFETPPSKEKLDALPDMNEHDPIYSEVYAAPKVQTPGLKPGKLGFKGGSPSPQVGASVLSPQRVGSQGSPGTPPPQGAVTPVQAAALAEPSAPSRGRSPRNEPIPLYETNSIGGRRRIAQSSSFYKLMQNMLGE